MYQKILLAILISLAALQVIAGILNSPRLAKLCVIGVVVLIATALILWVMLGWSPIPPWFTKLVRRAVNWVIAAVNSIKS